MTKTALSSPSPPPQDLTQKTTEQERAYTYRTREGSLAGGNMVIPKGDFGRFLGYTPPSKEELSGKQPMSADRVIEVALQNEFQRVGDGATKRGMQYRNQYVSWGVHTNQPGRERDMVRDLETANAESLEKRSDTLRPGSLGSSGTGQYFKMLEEYHQRSKEDNMRYLEMQYKFLYASKSFGTVSNMMKVRHDAIARSIRESR